MSSCIRLLSLLVAALTALPGSGHAAILAGRPPDQIPDTQPLQDLVTWDERSLFIRGERAFIFSGEVHPFRLPVASLYMDVFEKIKALGFNTVAFYIDWALLEGTPGEVRAEGIFDLQPFFDAALSAGVYLIARPGPHINGQVSGGGYPGWLQKVHGILRTDAEDYLNATENYMEKILTIIAKAQITNGGPVILVQAEDEYSMSKGGILFPNHAYMQYIIDQLRNNGILVPLISSIPGFVGIGAPGSGPGSVDLYGTNIYPTGFDCGHPEYWPRDGLPVDMLMHHRTNNRQFEGGTFDSYGGPGHDQCAALFNQDFERVLYKDSVAAGATVLNVYMAFGGTNWGNLGHSHVYTSNDFGAPIREDRSVDREKYSELKLQGQFLKVSPGLLRAKPHHVSLAISTNSRIRITGLTSNERGNFFLLGGNLTLHGRDSKWHVTDYDVGDYILLYCTAEVYTWKKFKDHTVLVLYGGEDEIHEFAFLNPLKIKADAEIEIMEGEAPILKRSPNNTITVQWNTSTTRTVIRYGDLDIYMVDRNSAYKYWVPTLPGEGKLAAYGTSLMNADAVIVNGGYLIRSATVRDSTLSLRADFNASTTLEIIGAPVDAITLKVNGQRCHFTVSPLGNWIAKPNVELPDVNLPDLSQLKWKQVDSLPEIHNEFDDASWVEADLRITTNPVAPLKTPVSLYGSDYGFHSGTLVFRGSFVAIAEVSRLGLVTQGGFAFGSSVWLDDTFVGSFKGLADATNDSSVYNLKGLLPGKKHVLTIIVDNNGYNQNYYPGSDTMKEPRGILEYSLTTRDGTEIAISSWRIAGNLGGEAYQDKLRGPLNEGGLFFERQGYHLPSPPEKVFTSGSPLDGISGAGVVFYSAKLTLDIAADKYDVPLSFVFDNTTDSRPYRAWLYVNGFQYGKYISHLGPQTEFIVPEGILDYNGDNWIGIGLWAVSDAGAAMPGLKLEARHAVATSREEVKLVPGLKTKQATPSRGGGKSKAKAMKDHWLTGQLPVVP
ncbi:putative beta-galactosidase A [Escovopsis weberi]|uniref:beta-galactosidase n=1 Tax=Escovopsis weberi TaxID=150374 RepID=A0A0M8MWQ6_ESCWE|nr:putative beta-galactosidase A [Escovopsis weberi]